MYVCMLNDRLNLIKASSCLVRHAHVNDMNYLFSSRELVKCAFATRTLLYGANDIRIPEMERPS